MVATLAGTGQYRDASIVSARPVVPGPVAEYTAPGALTSGSQINKAAVGGPTVTQKLTSGSSLDKAQGGAPWPGIVNGLVKFIMSPVTMVVSLVRLTIVSLVESFLVVLLVWLWIMLVVIMAPPLDPNGITWFLLSGALG